MSGTQPLAFQDLIRCNRCGTCRSVCPIFREMRAEHYVARGKLQLINAFTNGEMPLTAKMDELLELCLLCKACVVACPSQVPVDELVLAARATRVEQKGQSFVKGTIFHQLLPYSGRLGAAAGMLSLYQRSGIQALVRKSGLLGRLPGSLDKVEQLLPPVPPRSLRSQLPRLIPAEQPKQRVAYFIGCATNLIFQDVGRAVVEVLQRNNIEVYIPPAECCGIPARSSGDTQTARRLAEANLRWFADAQVDAILVDCASCGSTLKGYGEFLQTPAAEEFSRKVRDINEFLVSSTDFARGLNPVEGVVTYHDPCHLIRGQKISREPREILEAIPGLELREMQEADKCCGSAGSFAMSHYDLAIQVTRHKVDNILATGADLVATACPSCQMQISHGLQQHGKPLPVVHVVELLARAGREELGGAAGMPLPSENKVK